MIPANAISKYYIVQSKGKKKALDSETYDKLMTRNQRWMYNQQYIVMMNVGVGFFETLVNFAMNRKIQ